MKVMIVVTHLLGTGHLARALTLARAYIAAGDTVCVVSGGTPAPLLPYDDITFIQLPPVRSDGVDFTRLLTPTGTIITDKEMNIRSRMLLETLTSFIPDILITELFPFGRRILREEFRALLAVAKSLAPRPLVCASIRDILAPPSKPNKADFADEMVGTYYDAVLVHSDPKLTTLDLSWPVSPKLAPMLQYTGFVAPPAAQPHPNFAGKGEIIVSAGGGDVGGPIFEAALAAAPLLTAPMRILVGGTVPDAQIAALQTNAPENVVIEPARRDFRQMLYHAATSISLCGYNTALDILQAGTPAVFIPFDEGNEVEQGLRANALSAQSGIATLSRAALSPRSLFDTVQSVITAPRRDTGTAHFDGAARTVEITHDLKARA